MCWHNWAKWVDREQARSMSKLEVDMVGKQTGGLIGDLVITQERRCTKCNRLQLRQVQAGLFN